MEDIRKMRSRIRQTQKWVEVEDIVSNILSRLPVESLLKCKSVCKYWGLLISSPDFIRLQLEKSRENPSFITHSSFDRKWNTHLMKFDQDIFERISLPLGWEKFLQASLCSFNGLICWLYSFSSAVSLQIYICNPATRKLVLLPEAPEERGLNSIGVSFGPQINGYRVYGFSRKFDYSPDIKCDVYKYSSVTKSWKGIGSIGRYPLKSLHICINGIVYWLIEAGADDFIFDSVLGIDLEDNFIRIKFPIDARSSDIYFVEFEGRFSIVSTMNDIDRFDLWVLMDGNKSIWVKKWSDTLIPLNLKESERVYSVAARKKEILFIIKGPEQRQRCLVYGVDDKTWREVNWLDGALTSYPITFPFTESLLTCHGFIDG